MYSNVHGHFQHFCQSTESTLGRGKSSFLLLKMLFFNTVPVHAQVQPITIFIICFWIEGMEKKSTL